jgi:hypothetical protein
VATDEGQRARDEEEGGGPLLKSADALVLAALVLQLVTLAALVAAVVVAGRF